MMQMQRELINLTIKITKLMANNILKEKFTSQMASLNNIV